MLWGGPTDGAADCTPYLDEVAAAVSGTGDITLDVPAGQFQFLTQPRPLPRMRIRGQGKLATVFNKRFAGGALFTLIGHRGGGTVIEGLAGLTYAEHSPGYFAYLAGSSEHQPDVSVLRDLWVSSNDGGLWYINVVLDGLARASPQGLRGVLVEDCEFFNAYAANIWARDCVGLRVRGVGCFAGAGPAAGCGIYVSGGPSVSEQSTRCYFDDVNNNGQLNITNSFQCSFRGSIGSLVTDTESSHWRIDASCTGSVHNGLRDSVVELW